MISPSSTSLFHLQLSQIRILITIHDSMLNYIKQYNLFVAYLIKQSHHKDEKYISYRNLLIGLVIAFDKCVEQYNFYYMNMRMKHSIYFMVDPLALQQVAPPPKARYKALREQFEKNRMDFDQSSIQCRRYHNDNFIIKQYFVEDKEDPIDVKYRMHMEIWKKNKIGEETNDMLTRYEQHFMFQLLNKLYSQGFTNNFSSEHAIHLNNKKPNLSSYMSPHQKNHRDLMLENRKENPSLLLKFIEQECMKYLDFLSMVFSGQGACVACSTTFIYSKMKNNIVAPFVRIEGGNREYKIVHEHCLNNYMCGSPRIRKAVEQIEMKRQQQNNNQRTQNKKGT